MELAATGANGAVTWTIGTGECSGFPGLGLTPGGVIEGTPTAFGTGRCFLVRARDAQGNSHLKRFDITIVSRNAPTNTPIVRYGVRARRPPRPGV